MTTDQTENASAGASVHETGAEASNTATAKVSQCPSGSRLFTGDLQVAGLPLCRCVILVAGCSLCQRCQRWRSLSLCFKPMTTRHGSAIWLKQYVDGQISYWGTVSTDLTVPCAVCFGVPFQSSCSTTSVPSRSMIGSVQTLNYSYIQPPSPHRNDKTCLAAKVSLWMHLAMPAVRFRLVHAVVWGPSMWS